MAFSIGKILMAYRPLYLRGLLMDGQYRLPATHEAPATGRKAKTTTEVKADRVLASTVKPIRGTAT